MKAAILNIIDKKNKEYDNSKIKFSELLKSLNCTSDDLCIFLNGVQDARIENRIDWNN